MSAAMLLVTPVHAVSTKVACHARLHEQEQWAVQKQPTILLIAPDAAPGAHGGKGVSREKKKVRLGEAGMERWGFF